MDRLTENVLGNIQLKACGNDFCKETCAEHDKDKSCNNCPIQKAFEKLAEYEDLEEQGQLLKLPCKVGYFEHITNAEDKNVIEIIKEQPNAYDVDKVIKQLEQQKNQYFRRAEEIKNKFGENYESQKNYSKACSYDHAIEIIKSCRIDWRAGNEKNY